MAGKRHGTLFERLTNEDDPKVKREVSSGRRIGLYRLKKHLGNGSYGKVKLGIHLLTNGLYEGDL